MKNFKILIFTLVAFIAIFSLTSCKRATVDDPSMQINSGFRIILSGTANPSTLYVPDNNSAFSTTINVQALDNTGTPVNGAEILFEQYGAFYGYFDNNEISTKATTNSNGMVQIEFKFSAGLYVAGTQYLNVKATLVDDGRLDPQSDASAVTDTIPVKVVQNANTYIGEFKVHGDVNLSDGVTGISGVKLTITNLGINGIVQIYNRSSGSWDIMVPRGWTGTITPERSGYSFLPSYQIIATPVYEDISNVNFTGQLN